MKKVSDVKCFLLDMDGTIYLGNILLEGSLEFLKAVVDSGRDYLFLTNNSSHNANHYVKKLAKMGIHVGPEKVLTSGQATAMKCRHLFPGKKAFVLGNSFLFEELKDGGIEIYPAMGLSLTYDHRAVDGTPAAKFQKELCSNLENFVTLLAK